MSKKTDAQLLEQVKKRISEHLAKGEKVPRELSNLVSSLNKAIGKCLVLPLLVIGPCWRSHQ